MAKNITNREYKDLMRHWDANFPDDTPEIRRIRFEDYMDDDYPPRLPQLPQQPVVVEEVVVEQVVEESITEPEDE
jgi:hypothetical protein